MKHAVAVLAAMLLSAASAATVIEEGPDKVAILGDANPAKLSEFAFGLGNGNDRPRGAYAYSLRTPLFSDYAEKDRYIFIPPGTKARIDADGAIVFPVGTVIFKSFGWPDWNGGRPVETRLLIHRKKGWVALPYIWDADGGDATLAVGGRRVPVTFKSPDGDTHNIRYAVPNMNQCKECHSLNGAIVPIGPKAANIDFEAASAAYLQLPSAARSVPAMPRWDDPATGSVATRARAYLDVNCAHCHNPAGSASNSGLFLRWSDDPTDVNYGIGKRPTAAGRGSGGMDFAIAPGDPARSFMIYRLESTDPGIAMPEVGRSTVHKEGAALLRQWIAEMPKGGPR